MDGRKERLEGKIPYLDFDFERFSEKGLEPIE
jgi:hypothetical protein